MVTLSHITMNSEIITACSGIAHAFYHFFLSLCAATEIRLYFIEVYSTAFTKDAEHVLLDTRKLRGSDNISSVLLKIYAELISHYLLIIFRTSLW